tara:strand:- start:301 stop:906 length:606 start_codon:yes stop_codon:yes gene_type:complete
MMDNDSYWENFYNSKEAKQLNVPSDFAIFTSDCLQESKLSQDAKILDLGCGTGRDTYYFLNLGYTNVCGLDKICPEGDHFVKGDLIENIQHSDVFYMRFFVHAVDEERLDVILSKIDKAMDKDGLVFIETRSTKGLSSGDKTLVNFKSSVGEKHFRMLYSLEYLKAKVEKNFTMLYCVEEKGLAKYKQEDPYIIRMVLGKE